MKQSVLLMRALLLVLAVLCTAMSLCAQTPARGIAPSIQSPDVDVRGAKAEFISSNEKPVFAVVGIVVLGDVDTLSVVVHPSAIQSIDGKYRYKPKVVSTRRIDSLFEIVLELSGKGIPLQEDSVRGAARLSVRGAGNFRGSRVRFESKRFEVFVANVPPPAILIVTNDIKVEPIFDNAVGTFKVRGVLVRALKKGLDSIEDIRQVSIDTIYAEIRSAEVGEVNGNARYAVFAVDKPKLASGTPTDGTYDFTFMLSGKFPLARNMIRGTASVAFTVVARYRDGKRHRIKVQSVSIHN